jgi:UDP-N-acetylmuramyl pentapeptide phosphotransferase/UDP-N-acetylglucosamine-1-phosphate transferase
MGGIPIVVAYLASFALMRLLADTSFTIINYSLPLRVAPAVAIIFILGIIDDRFGLRAPEKLAAQVIAAG